MARNLNQGDTAEEIKAAIAQLEGIKAGALQWGATWYAIGRAVDDLREALQHAQTNDGFPPSVELTS